MTILSLKFASEMMAVGIMTIIFGYIITFLLGSINGVDLVKLYKQHNKNYLFELSLFLIGVSIHLFCEVTHINKWYCINGNACSV